MPFMTKGLGYNWIRAVIMAFIFKLYRSRIADRMALGDREVIRWLHKATFAKTSNGYWLAWH